MASEHGHTHGHSHDHDHGLSHHHGAPGRLGTAFVLNVSFTIIELVGAWATNSTAIAADAVHDLGDSLALAFAWFMERSATARPTSRFTFGFRRLSAMGALVNAGVIAGGSFIVVYEAVPRLFDPPQPHAPGMIGLAVVGLVVNGVAAWRVQGASGLNARVVTWHLLEDVLGWAAVLVGAIVLWVAELPILDPLLSIAIALFVSVNAVRHGRRAAEVLLQGVPEGLEAEQVRAALGAHAVVREVRHLHLWSQDGENHVVTAELVVDGALCVADLEPVRADLRETMTTLGVDHVTLEFALASSPNPGRCGAPE